MLGLALCSNFVFAQATASLRGQVVDEQGAAIVGATVTLVDANNAEKTTTTNDQGYFLFNAVLPGKYFLRVIASGFAMYEKEEFEITTARREPLNIKLTATIEKQKVTINSNDTGVSTDADANKSALVLKGKDLDALPDDPDDLAAALQAMAGPSAGPNGGQLFVDGFSGGSMPPKEAIREIRINSNPFAAENDRIGFGRIEILTKPGVDKFHGSANFIYNNQSFNSRNPFVDNKPDSQFKAYNASFSGPIVANKASFFLNVFHRDIEDNGIVKATILDSNLNPTPFSQAVVVPRLFTDASGRFDYQLSKNHTLVARYGYSTFSFENIGVQGYSLPSRASVMNNHDHNLQLTETAIVNSSVVNETRFQFVRSSRTQTGDNSVPTIMVLDAFTGGGANVGRSLNQSSRYEIQNYTTWIKKNHTFKFGGRIRGVVIDDLSSNNFGGTYVFFGGAAPTLDAANNVVSDGSGHPIPTEITSLERYRRTLLFQQLGFSPAEILARGGGASQLSITGGNPKSGVRQWDFGPFFQDDWKVRPDLTLSYGLRYEQQTNISSDLNFAPRVAFAWSPGLTPGKPTKNVIRGGFGIFYDRAGEGLTLQASRFNGINQQQFTVTDPAVLSVFPHVPAISTLNSFALPQNTYRVSDDLSAPYTMQSSISLERQLPWRTILTTTYLNSRGVHYLRLRNINAPLPGTFNPLVPGSGVHPFGDVGNIFEYESNGIFKQNQLIVSVQNRLNKYVSIAGNYVFGKTQSDTDGSGSLPANTYDLRDEFGRTAFDARHRGFIFGSINLPWQVSLSPLIFISSGTPFNITTGVDANGDTASNERPAFATDLSRKSVKVTRFGAFDLSPLPGAQLIPRNFGQGSGSFTMNMRIAKNFGFGRSASAKLAAAQQAQAAKATASNGAGNGAGGGAQGKPVGGPNVGGPNAKGPGGPGGGPMMAVGMGGGAMMMIGGPGNDHPYNLSVSLNASNILNHVNPGAPVGNLSSPFFAQSTGLGAGGIQFGGGAGGGAGAANNRRLDLSVSFRF